MLGRAGSYLIFNEGMWVVFFNFLTDQILCLDLKKETKILKFGSQISILSFQGTNKIPGI